MGRTLAWAAAGSAMLLAAGLSSTASAQQRGNPGTRVDDGTCYAIATEALRDARTNTGRSGTRYGSGNASSNERDFKRDCAAPATRLYQSEEPVYIAPDPVPEVEPAYVAPVATYDPLPTQVITVTNGPVPDTVSNRRRYGGPDSNGGRITAPRGN